jgi:hypothetical protein
MVDVSTMAFTEFTPEKKSRFIASLRKEPNVSKACRRAGVSRTTAYLHHNPESELYDVEFSEAWEEALVDGLSLLDEEMWRRAVKGTKKPVFYEGRVCGHIQEYSDTLAIFLAKAHMPEKYRERQDNRTLNIDMASLSDEQLARIANGEDPFVVVATTSKGGN